MSMDFEERKILNIGDKCFAINIFIESRYGSRVSITNKGINIRISKYLSNIDKAKQIDEYINWARDKIEKKLAKSPPLPPYSDGLVVTFLEESFTLSLKQHAGKEKILCKLHLQDKIIEISYPDATSERALQKNIGVILNKIMIRYFQPIIEKRLHELNNRFINKSLKKVTLKNTSTRWGSCSHDGNISISTRLLFAPILILDYVLIHELCHLVHHNHSASFWNLVAHIYPNYKQAEKFLADKGGSYNF